MLNRRQFSTAVLSTAALGAMAPARAQSGAPIHLLVGFPPGGGSDAIARILAERLHAELGRTILVENKPGAGGQIAAQHLKAAKADGTTLFLSHDHTISILPQVVRKPGFDSQADFEPVGGLATFVNGLALSDSTPASDMATFIDWIEAQGSQAAIGIPAPASTPEFLVQLLASKYRLDLTPVPYRGSAPMMADMLGGQIPAGVGSVPDFIEYQRAGKLRMVAVLGGKRQAALPDVPTFTELGVSGLEDLPFYGIWAPRGVPAEFTASFSQALQKVLTQREVYSQLTGLGLNVEYMDPAQLDARERAYTAAWKRIIAESGFQPQ